VQISESDLKNVLTLRSFAPPFATFASLRLCVNRRLNEEAYLAQRRRPSPLTKEEIFSHECARGRRMNS
jgi:hypothetical protein